MNPGLRHHLQRRAALLAAIRQWMARRQIVEVDTPALWPWANTDPAIESLPVAGYGYLHTSPELGMKRLLALGSGDIYQLSHVFRHEEHGPLHRAEFMMLEWYRLNMDHRQLARETVELIQHLRRQAGLEPARTRNLSYRDLFLQYRLPDPLQASEDTLRHCCREHGLHSWHGRQAALDFLLSVAIAPQLEPDTLYTVQDYPAEQAALARTHQHERGHALAARFEIMQGGIELANGYHELAEGHRYRQRMEAENRLRRQRNQEEMPLDHPLCRLLEERPLPDCAGVALGVDRLLMLLDGHDCLQSPLPAHLQPQFQENTA